MEEYIPQFIATASVLLLTPLSKYIVRKLVNKYGRISFRSEVRMTQMIRVISMLINATCFLALAIIWGVQPQNMLVTLSSIFAVIGVAMFAQWSILSNITAGIIIFFTMPFRVGDEISILDKDLPIDAVIENVQTFSIHLRTKEGELIVLSNSMFLQKTILLKEAK